MFLKRLAEIRTFLKKQKLDAVLVSDVSNITYLTGYANFSETEREAYIFLGKDFAYIITDGRYSEAIKKEVPNLTLFERGSEKLIEDLFKKHGKAIKLLGVEEDNLTVSEHKFLKKHFRKIKNFNVSNQRSIKTLEEIQKIQRVCRIGDLAFEYILKKIKPGISEKELAFEIEFFVKKHGAELSFPSIVAFGKNSAIPHHQTGKTMLENKEGQFILLDFGVKFENYCSDMTRTVFFGKLSDEQKKIYQAVLQAQQKAVDFINQDCYALRAHNDMVSKTGKIMASEVDKVARDYLISQRYPTIPHSLGHGIGLAVHEHPSLSPKSKDILKEGMVFSIEPGIYLEGFGGVRIEDLFVLDENGLRQLTNSPKDMIIL